MPKILITGANGLLGQKIIRGLASLKNVETIATSRGENRIALKNGYLYQPLDIVDPDQVNTVLQKHKPECVINTAAMTNVDACEKDQASCRKINVDGVTNLVKASESFGAHLIHLSTDFIFDGKSGPYREEDIPHPLGYYAQSKLESEKIVQAANIPWTIIRTILLYGYEKTLSRSNIVLWAKNNLEQNKTINVVTDQFRSPTLAEDLADGCIQAAVRKAAGIYHVSGPDLMSILELVQIVAEVFGLNKNLIKPTTTLTLSEAAARPPKTGFILDKARRCLGYNPHSFQGGLTLLKKQVVSDK